MYKLSRFITMLSALLLLALSVSGAYTSIQAAVTKTPIPTKTAVPTRTPLPTKTPRPSPTPKTSPTSATTSVGTLAIILHDTAAHTQQLVLVDTDGKNFKPLQVKAFRSAAWSPDGTHLLIDGTTITDADGSNPQPVKILDSLGSVTSFTWAPDSKHLTTFADPGTITNVDPVTGERQDLFTLNGASGVVPLRWTPDGQRLAYVIRSVGGDPTNTEVHVIDAAGTNDQLIAPPSGDHSVLMWSPDSRKFAYCGRTPKNLAGVFIIDPASKALTTITNGCDFGADWSPDGTQFAYSDEFTSNKDGDLFIVAASGGKPRHVSLPVNGDTVIASISWRPPVSQNSAAATGSAEPTSSATATADAQAALTETYIASDKSFSFKYPADWGTAYPVVANKLSRRAIRYNSPRYISLYGKRQS